MKRLVCISALAGLAAAASARGPVGLDLSLSDDLGANWGNTILTVPGTTIWVQVAMTIPDSYYGIGVARYNIVCTSASGWDFGGNDTVDLSLAKGNANDGRMAGFDFGGQTQQIFESPGSLRIDAKGDTNDSVNAGISTSQNTPPSLGTNFNIAKSAVVFRFRVVLSSSTAVRNLVFRIADGGSNGSVNQITSFKGYETASSTFPAAIAGPITGDSVEILVIPAPATIFPAAITGVLLRRRR